VSVELPEHLPPVWAEAASISDALLNLLTNASKYGGHPAEIVLRAAATARQVRISVQDNGLGIAAREHKRIFQKFYRVDDRLSRDKEGSGLGLAIAKHVVKAHEGHIELRSAPGKGSVFTIVLPVWRSQEAPALEARAGKA
jgi:two-component system phosphate regulon sensor histidine kinase PhoR